MLILLGKSCSGKTTIQKELSKLGMSPIIQYTTRPKREGEIDGVTYNFVSDDDFIELENANFFIETSYYEVANGDIWRYGTAYRDLDDNKVLIANPSIMTKMVKLLCANINPVTAYINTNENIIWDRMMRRGDDIKEAQRRVVSDANDFYGIEENIDFMFSNNGEIKPDILAEMIKYSYECLRNSLIGGDSL